MPSSVVRRFARAALRTANRALSHAGLRLQREELDFDNYPIDPATRAALFGALARGFDDWIGAQRLFAVEERFDTALEVERFFETWMTLPFRTPFFGSRFNNLLWLNLLTRSFGPDVVIDSGTWEGASAWAMHTGAPRAAAYSFDIDLSHLGLRCPGVIYVEDDWARYGGTLATGSRVLAYFDDHVDQARRLIEAAERGCSLAIFDDDYPLTSFYHMAPTPDVLPKIELVLDESLLDGQVLEWRTPRGTRRFTVDRSYLDRAKACIRATERLPFTGLTTGILQTPYRLVAL